MYQFFCACKLIPHLPIIFCGIQQVLYYELIEVVKRNILKWYVVQWEVVYISVVCKEQLVKAAARKSVELLHGHVNNLCTHHIYIHSVSLQKVIYCYLCLTMLFPFKALSTTQLGQCMQQPLYSTCNHAPLAQPLVIDKASSHVMAIQAVYQGWEI